MDETLSILHRVMVFGGIYIYSKGEWNSNLRLFHQILNFLCGCSYVVFTTGFLIDSCSNIGLWLEGVAIWGTARMLSLSLGICLVYKNKFRIFIEEMVFKDAILTMPFVEHIMKREYEGKLNELKTMIEESRDKLFKNTRILTKRYVAFIIIDMTLYMCDALYNFISTTDSLRPLGK